MQMQTWRADWPTGHSDPNILPDLYERGKAFGPPFREAFLTIPEGKVVWHNRLAYWPTMKCDSRGGWVTLAGDAAHPMTFRSSPLSSFPITFIPSFSLYLSSFISPFSQLFLTRRSRPRPRPQQRHNRRRRAAHPSPRYVSHTPAELPAAVQRYETDLWPRGHEAVMSSLENTDAVHDWKTMMSSPLFTGGLAREVDKATL